MRLSALLTSVTLLLLTACTRAYVPFPPRQDPPPPRTLFVLDLRSLTLMEVGGAGRRIALPMPDGCSFWGLSPAPSGDFLAVEMECSDGPLAMVFDPSSGMSRLLTVDPLPDSQVLAWDADSQGLYVRYGFFSSPGTAHIRFDTARPFRLDLPAQVYDLAPAPDGTLVYSLTYGLGFGGESALLSPAGNSARPLLTFSDALPIYMRWSPDGTRLAYILIPDSQTPYTTGSLWWLSSDGVTSHRLADADGGHGFPPAWSPDGRQIAFVHRENPSDPAADRSFAALRSNIYLADADTFSITPLTSLPDALVEAPLWSPDGGGVYFTVRIGDTIQVWSVPRTGGQAGPVLPDSPVCCAVWLAVK